MHKADHELGTAIESDDLEQLKSTIEKHQDIASEDALREARRVRDKMKKRARKQKKASAGTVST